jgi:hypothetical protein
MFHFGEWEQMDGARKDGKWMLLTKNLLEKWMSATKDRLMSMHKALANFDENHEHC